MDWSSRARRSAGRPLMPNARLLEEALRAWQPAAEFGLLVNSPVFWGWGVPRGDGHPVMALPGLLAGDGYLRPLRDWLGRVGYRAVPSGIGRNLGWSEELVGELGDRVQQEYDRGGQRLTLVGHSMGGVLARSVAARRPQIVRHVVALSSPLGWSRGRLPESVRFTAIYSREDRVVRYPGARAQEPGAENIEVRGSHIGMASNPEVYRQLGKLLPLPERTMV